MRPLRAKRRGNLSIDGWVKNLFQSKARQPFAFRVDAQSFHAFNKRSLADLYLTTAEPLRLAGSVQSSTLTGALVVPRGAIFLVDRDLARKQAVERIAHTTAFGVVGGGGVPPMLATLMSNLRISNVTVTLGNDVYLRSAEANVKLAGELRLEPSTVRSTRTLASGELVPQLSLFGTLRTVGGHYNLNLGLVQREFQVLSDGSVTFNGPPESDARRSGAIQRQAVSRSRPGHHREVAGTAVAVSRNQLHEQRGLRDRHVRSRELPAHRQAGLRLRRESRHAQVLSSFLAPTVSAYTSDRLRQSFGSFFDVFQFQLGTTGNATAGSSFLSTEVVAVFLNGSTIGAEKQFSNNVYLSVNTGLCQFDPHSNTSFNNLNLFGAKVEYRLNPTTSTSAGI